MSQSTCDLFFFFQAEDGIRDIGVTGVQTCALPILDATRITLAASATGIDFPWRDERVESYRNFANKIWNATRFCLMNSEGAQAGKGFEGEPQTWALHDRWIVSRLNRTARDVGRAIETYQFHEAVYALYHFFWDDFCDWYIELSKADVTAAAATPERDAARSREIGRAHV